MTKTDEGEQPWEKYSTAVEPTTTGRTAPNTIIELPLLIEGPGGGLGPDESQLLHPDALGTLADVLSEQGADTLSAELDIARRYAMDAEDPSEHTVRFTASTLTDIVVLLAVAITEAKYAGQSSLVDIIGQFGQLIEHHEDAPFDAETDVTLPGLEPMGGGPVDPFAVIARRQDCRIVDDDGTVLEP